MQREPTAPVMGQRLSVSREREIARFLRESRLIPGNGIRLSRGPNGVLIEATAKSTTKTATTTTDTLEPFFLRQHVTDDDSSGQVEVYLPLGSMTTEDDCVPLNVPADKKSGHTEEDDEKDWYAVSGMESLSKGDTGSIMAYVMPGHHMIVARSSTVDSKYDKCAIVKYALALFTVNEEKEEDESGKETSRLVVDFGTQSNTGSKHTTATAVYAHGTNNLEWELEKDENTGAWKIKTLKLVDVRFDAGGDVLTADDTEIGASASKVYLKIAHADSAYSLTVEIDPEKAENTDDATWRILYTLESQYPVTDYRFTLNTMLFLR